MVHLRGALNLPAPDDTDPAALLPETFRDMVDALGISVGAGVTVTNTVTLAAGWSLDTATLRRVALMGALFVHLEVTRTGGDISSTATGDVAPNVNVCTLPAGWRPTVESYTVFHRKAAAPWSGYVNDDGLVELVAGPPSKTLTTGSVLVIDHVYTCI